METLHGGDSSENSSENNLIEQSVGGSGVDVEKAKEAFQALEKSKLDVKSATTEEEKNYALSINRNRGISFMQQAGAAPYIYNSYTHSMNLGNGKWRDDVNNNALVSAVADDIAFQKNLKATGKIGGGSGYVMQDNRPKYDMSVIDVVEKDTPKTPEELLALAKASLGSGEKNMEMLAPYKKRTPEEFDRLTKEALGRMEGVKETLTVRNEKTKERLLEMGLNGLVKGVEVWKNVSPRKKFLIGLTLAGASVASGGLTSFISKGLSTLTYASAHYHEKLQKLEEKGEEIDKRKLAVQSITRGFILAMASSQLMGLLAPHVPEAFEAVKEKFSSVKDGVKEWFSSFKDVAPVPDTGVALSPGMDNSVFPNGFTSPEYTVSTPDSLSAGESLAGPNIVVLPDHIVQPGENLTKIIKEHVIKTIPNYQNLSPFQQNSMIENLLKQASLNKGQSFYDAINTFADPSKLAPGQTVNLTQIRDALTGYTFNQFGGKTLLEHAQGLYEYASSPVAPTSSYDYVTSSAPSVAPSYPPVNPADFGAMDATSQDADGLTNGKIVGPAKPLTPEEIIELNDKVLQKEGTGRVNGVQGGEFTSQA